MSRSCYSEEMDNNWEMICWRGAVASAIRGKRGQEFLRNMLAALDALPEKRLIADLLEDGGEVCAIGSVGRLRGIDMSLLDPDDYDGIASTFGISPALVREIEFINDENDFGGKSSPERRFAEVRKWVVSQLVTSKPSFSGTGPLPSGPAQSDEA